MSLTFISRLVPRSVTPLVIGVILAIAMFPFFLKFFFSREIKIEADLSFSSDVPSIKVQWDDPRIISEPFKVVPIPGHSEPSKQWHIRISSSGEKHPDSRSSEVWIFGAETPERRLELKDVSTDGASKWTIVPDGRAVGGILYAAGFNGPKVWEGRIKGSGLTLYLLNHSWSGKATISVNGVSEDVDLYAPSDGVIITRSYSNPATGPQIMQEGRITFSVPSGQTYTDELLFSSTSAGTVTITSASSNGKPLVRLGPNKYASPSMGLYAHMYAAAATVALWIVITLLCSFLASFLPPVKILASDSITTKFSAFTFAITATGLLTSWNAITLSLKVALVNLLPAFITYAVIAGAAARLSSAWRYLLIGSWFFLTLRTPLLGAAYWDLAHGIALAAVVLIGFKQIFDYFERPFERRLTLVGFALIIVVSLTHLGILSPYTYAAIRPIWPDQYIMRINGVLTNADLPHFMDLFSAYTKPEHKAGFSTVLRRFFYEYLWSTAWPVRPIWAAGTIINLLMWAGSMLALLRLATMLVTSRRSLTVVVIGVSSSLAFASVVGQPILYLSAYAWIPILLLGMVRFTAGTSWRDREFWLACVAAAVATYDVLPVIMASALTLLFVRRYLNALTWLSAYILVTFAWSELTLLRVLRTFGNPTNAEFLSKSISAWKDVLNNTDLATIGIYVMRGIENAVYAGFGIGLLVVPALIVAVVRPKSVKAPNVAIACIILTVLYVLSACLIAPQLPFWSPGGLVPRYSYYYYPASLLGLSVLADRLPRWFSGVIVVCLVLLVFADTLGYFRPTMLLHYGNWYGIFTKW